MADDRMIERDLLHILEEAPGIMWTTDRELRFTSSYGAGLSLLGLTQNQVVGTPLSEFFHTSAEDFPAIAAHRRALAGEPSVFQQHWQGCLFQVSIQPHRDVNGDIDGCIGIAQDITALREAEEQTAQILRLQEAIGKILDVFAEPQLLVAQLERCLDILLALPWLNIQSRGAVFLVDREHQTLCLKAQRRLPESLQSACAHVPFGHCLCGRVASTADAVFADCVDYRHETRYNGMSDHGHYCVPLLSDREVVGVLNLYVQPHHRRIAEEEQFLRSVGFVMGGAVRYWQMAEELRESEERLALAVRGSDVGIWDWDLQTDHVHFSPRWKNMLGYADHEIADQFNEWESRLHPDDRERALTTVRDYLDGKLPEYELEHRLRHRDGSYRWILARGGAVRNAAGKPYRMAGSHLDITERKNLEKTLVNKEVELKAAAEIQEYLLPRSPPKIPGFDVAGRCYPADLVAGDYFDFHRSSDGSHLLVAADVSGHGVGPAILTACFHAGFLALAEAVCDLPEIAEILNSRLWRETSEGMFITMIAARIDPARRTLTCVNAGHPSGIVLDRTGNVKATLPSTCLPLAISPEVEVVASAPLLLEDDDSLLFFTDGLIEAHREGQPNFGIDRVIGVIREYRAKTAAEIIEALHRAVRAYLGDEKPHDDITVILAKVQPR